MIKTRKEKKGLVISIIMISYDHGGGGPKGRREWDIDGNYLISWFHVRQAIEPSSKVTINMIIVIELASDPIRSTRPIR